MLLFVLLIFYTNGNTSLSSKSSIKNNYHYDNFDSLVNLKLMMLNVLVFIMDKHVIGYIAVKAKCEGLPNKIIVYI